MKILHLLGFHDILYSVETGKNKFEYQSPSDLMITKFNEYLCLCGRKFWMPPTEFNRQRMENYLAKLQLDTVKMLIKRGDVDEAIKVFNL